MDINQGNLLDEDRLAKLRPGMSQDEVRFLLGTPMLTDIFHSNRWDYVYYNKPGKEEPEQKRMTLFFDSNDRLERIEPPLAAPAAGADLGPR